MKKLIAISIVTATLSACKATHQQEEFDATDFVDLSQNVTRFNDNEYWKLNENIPKPKYPLHLYKDRIVGCAVVKFGINSEGKTQNHQVVSSYPKRAFEKSAIEAIKRTTWTPTAKNNSKTPILISARINYCIEPDEVILSGIQKDQFENCSTNL